MAEELLPEVQELIEKVKKGPERINGYELVRHIGHGAFAEVFEAFADRFHKIPVALKLPRTRDAIGDIKTRQIVLSALGKCSHSVNMVGEGKLDATPYVVEEFVDLSLADVIAQNREQKVQPSLEQILDLGRQLFTGAAYFHELETSDPTAAQNLGIKSLTHNDIKPSNIMVSKDVRSGAQVYRYTDFGIRIEETPGAQAQTSCVNSASIASIKNLDRNGKVNRNIYAAPEVREALLRQEAPPATSPSDLWSITAVLFAYATGSAPQWGERDPRLLREDLPEGMTDFFKKALQGSPEKRFQSAREALSALEEAVNFSEDGSIFGITLMGNTDYFAFKQPIRKGKPVKKASYFAFTHGSGCKYPPSFIYIPSLKELFLSRWSESTAEGYDTDMLDLDLEIISHQDLGGVPSAESYSIGTPVVLQNKKTGQIGVRQESWYAYAGCSKTHLTTTQLLPSFENASEKNVKAGLLSDWKEVKPNSVGPTEGKYLFDKAHVLGIDRDGLYVAEGYNDSPFGIVVNDQTKQRINVKGNVISAFCVPKE
jgi:serine/threonine protein kinase